MACYKRIMYLDYYEDGIKHTNVGFVKLIQWKKDGVSDGEQTCFQIYVSNFLPEDEIECTVKVISNSCEILLGQVEVISGKGMSRIRGPEDALLNMKEAGIREDILLRIELTSSRYFECMLQPGMTAGEKKTRLEASEVVGTMNMREPEMTNVEESARRNVEESEVTNAKASAGMNAEDSEVTNMEESEVMNVKESDINMSETVSSEAEGCVIVQRPHPRRSLHVHRDKWKQLWEMFPHIRPFDDEREYLRIELQDMVVLSNLYYRLVENSFLLHGYYNYGHLILMKMYKRGKERIYVGVPGNFYEKEKQVAVMFGFESFEPKAEPAAEADFGYYLIGVDI